MDIIGKENLLKWQEKLKKEQSEKPFVNEYQEKIQKKIFEDTIVSNTPTAKRLLRMGKDGTKERRIGSDAFALYNFYCYCSSIQKNNSVWATDFFCRKGLSWGEIRFRKAKNLLKKEKIITLKTSKIKGKISKHFIRIHYLSKVKP